MGTAERKDRELAEREAALLAAAAALAAREPWQAVTVEAIAARAEHAKGTVYKHFASKDAILARLVARWSGEISAALDALDADRPFEALLRDVLGTWWRELAGRRERVRLVRLARSDAVLARLPPAERAGLAEAEARLKALLAELVAIGIEEGALPAGPAEPRLRAVEALLEGVLANSEAWEAAGDPGALVAGAVLALLGASVPAPVLEPA